MDVKVGDATLHYIVISDTSSEMSYIVFTMLENVFLFVPKFQDSPAKGGVVIDHQIHEGKHQYEVKNVVKYKKPTGVKWFARYVSYITLQWHLMYYRLCRCFSFL